MAALREPPRGPTQKPRGRLRVPLSDTAPPRPTRYTWRRPPRHLAPADTAPAAGRHGTCRRPTQHLAPADSHTQRRPTRPPRRPTHRGRHRPCPTYYGSTCESLSQRMTRHRAKYTAYLKGNITNTRSFDLFDEFGIENCKIELVENCPCNSKEELRRREGYYMRFLQNLR